MKKQAEISSRSSHERIQIQTLVKAFGSICMASAEIPKTEEQAARAVMASVRDMLMEMDRRLSVFLPDSEISRLNRRGWKEAVRVSTDTFALLREAKYYAEATEGIFDVSIGKYTESWRQNKRGGSLLSGPQESSAELKGLSADLQGSPAGLQGLPVYLQRSFANAGGLILEEYNFTARLAGQELEVDLGGIAKGYAIDRARELLLSAGIDNALLNFGGTVSVIGQEKTIGLQNPFLPRNLTGTGHLFGTLRCQDEVIVTSGIYEQGFGEKQESHHIIDPGTGLPSKTDLLSASVVDRSGTAADAYATTLIVLGLEKGIAFAEKKKLSVVFVTREGKVFLTPSLRERFTL